MDVRAAVLRHLAQPGDDKRFGRSYLPSLVATAVGCQAYQVWEALWGLVGEGLVYLDTAGQGSGTDNWQWRLSTAGAVVVTGGPWEPRDPAGYLQRLRHDAPNLDPVALRYVEEALRAFNARCYLATSVMLGVASEAAFAGLAAAFVHAQGARAERLGKLLGDRRSTYFARFQQLRRSLEPIRDQLPDDLADVLTLDAVADLLRVTRNSVGHPSGATVDEDTARTHLLMAARYLARMTAMAHHFDHSVN